MKIERNRVVTLTYEVKTEEGQLVDTATSDDPLVYLHGHGNLIPGLENALVDKAQGDSFQVTIAPADAYGEFNDALVQRVPANLFGEETLEVGMRFIADTDQGQVPVEITEVDGDEVVVDGNHMLAGEALVFDVQVGEVREATADEVAHGHVHGAHGHHHDHDHDHECCGGGGCGNDGCCSH